MDYIPKTAKATLHLHDHFDHLMIKLALFYFKSHFIHFFLRFTPKLTAVSIIVCDIVRQRYTITQRIEIVKIDHKSNESILMWDEPGHIFRDPAKLLGKKFNRCSFPEMPMVSRRKNHAMKLFRPFFFMVTLIDWFTSINYFSRLFVLLLK